MQIYQTETAPLSFFLDDSSRVRNGPLNNSEAQDMFMRKRMKHSMERAIERDDINTALDSGNVYNERKTAFLRRVIEAH